MSEGANPYGIFEALGKLGEHADRHASRHRSKPTAHVLKHFADPSIEAMARTPALQADEKINELRIAGQEWYVARERVIAANIKEWTKIYKENSDTPVIKSSDVSGIANLLNRGKD